MTTYIVIPSTRRLREEKPSALARLAIGTLRRILPAANPDFEHLYEQVATWHIEIGAHTGEPLREVGLDSEGKVTVIGPWRDNHGFIVDCNGKFDPSEYQHVSGEEFEREWKSFHAANVI